MTNSPFPLEPTAADAQAAIADEFGFFGDWSERYQYLIDLGRKLPDFPEEWKTEEHRLHGCQSMVWIVPGGDAARLEFHAVSDSAIVSGLVYLALRVYSGRSAQEILELQRERLGRDRATELATAAQQQREITHLRIDQTTGAPKGD